jgi:hypothetical protein
MPVTRERFRNTRIIRSRPERMACQEGRRR